jgi:GNAT superfamily N-acetyltransferase
MIEIKEPNICHASEISALLISLGYPETERFIEKRIAQFLSRDDEVLLVAIEDGAVIGIISLHFIPQLALAGDFCRICYFCIKKEYRGKGIGAMLELRTVEMAKERGCDRIEVHCHSRRVDAHRFYYQQGYLESPKYLCKLLNKV